MISETRFHELRDKIQQRTAEIIMSTGRLTKLDLLLEICDACGNQFEVAEMTFFFTKCFLEFSGFFEKNEA